MRLTNLVLAGLAGHLGGVANAQDPTTITGATVVSVSTITGVQTITPSPSPSPTVVTATAIVTPTS